MYKILITGGAGFIGSNLVEYFLNKGHFITVLDNFSTGHRHNVEGFLSNPNFILIKGDICDLETCKLACEDKDYVLHQAALGSVPRSIENPIATNQANIVGFLNMLVAARDAKVKRFIYAASSSTYGDSESLPKVEDVIGKPLSPYAVTKYVNELYADVFSKTYGIECIGLRYFNVFGPRQDPCGAYAAVIPKWIALLADGKECELYGDGATSRDFCYIDNVVQANILAAVASKEASNQVYNIALGGRITLLELYDRIRLSLEEKHGKNVPKKPVMLDERAGDVKHSLANISKAEKLLGYTSIVPFDEGIDKTVDWFLSNREV